MLTPSTAPGELSGRLSKLDYLDESDQVFKAACEVFREIGIDHGEAICEDATDSTTPSSVLDVLTEKQLDVVKLLVRGAKNQTITHELYVSVRTVELRLTNIFRKVGVKSRINLMKRVAPELETLGDGAQRNVREPRRQR